jgi:hypothetical protein
VLRTVEFISDRMSYIILIGRWCNIIVLNVLLNLHMYKTIFLNKTDVCLCSAAFMVILYSKILAFSTTGNKKTFFSLHSTVYYVFDISNSFSSG